MTYYRCQFGDLDVCTEIRTIVAGEIVVGGNSRNGAAFARDFNFTNLKFRERGKKGEQKKKEGHCQFPFNRTVL